MNDEVATLTPDQQHVYDQLTEFSRGTDGGMFVMSGFAGTGKTYLTTRFIDSLVGNGRAVLVTAPTHKAVKVLRALSGDSRLQVNFRTLHSALGLKEVITKDGEQTFQVDRMQPAKIAEYYYMVVDEVSMMNDELFGYVNEYVNSNHLKVIFVGDPLQIPPVKKDDCIPFDQRQQMLYEMRLGHLSKIVRQAESNPIIKVSMGIRENIAKQNVYGVCEDNTIGATGIQFLRSQDGERLRELLYDHFTCQAFQDNPDHAKVIAWTNRTVDAFNQMIRKMIYHDKYTGSLPKLMRGEMLIADAPIMEEGTTRIQFTTNSEMQVLDYTVKDESINAGQFVLRYYDAQVMDLDEESKHWIKVIHEDSTQTYNEILQMLKQNAISLKGSYKAAEAWKDYYEFMEHFARVKYNYAITAHKSQGSTYDTSFVVDYDMNLNSNLRERNRIKYTACTRSRKMLYVLL